MQSVPHRSERGATAVEFALLVSFFFAIVFGIVEVGMLFRSKHSVEHGVAEAARRGSVAGTSPQADFEILDQLQSELADNGDSITRVIIYRASVPTDDPAAACQTGSTSAAFQCNVYLNADLDRPIGDFGACGPVDGGWCPTTRNDSLANPDYIGIWVQMDHQSSMGVLDDITLVHKNVMPIEPARRN